MGPILTPPINFLPRLEATAWDMYQSMEQRQEDGYEINGFTGGVRSPKKFASAQYREGWDLMLSQYERDDDWGLQIYDKRRATSFEEYENFLRCP